MQGLLQSKVFRICKVYCSQEYLDYERFTAVFRTFLRFPQKYLEYARFTAVRSIYNMQGLLQSEVFKICKVYCSQKYLEYARFTAVRSI